MHRPCPPAGQRDYVIEKRYDGTSQMPFSAVKIDWTYDALGRLVAQTRDLDGNGQRDVGDYTDLFAFDLAGNRVLKVRAWDVNGDGVLDGEEIDQATTSTHNARDQLLQGRFWGRS